MNTEPNTLTRREALLNAIKGSVAATLALPVIAESSQIPTITPEPEFIPENDYPFFGYEPDTNVAAQKESPATS